MFKVRVLSAAAGLALLAIVMLSPKEVLGVAVFALSLLGINEFYGAVSKTGLKPLKPLGYFSCLPLLLLAFYGGAAAQKFIPPQEQPGFLILGVFAIMLIACSFMVIMHPAYNVADMSITIFGVLYVPFLLSFLTLTRNLIHGSFFIWLIFIGAWITDTFAYFTGVAIGKRKLTAVSPKKTLEGSIGGIAGCIASTVIYGILIGNYIEGIPLYHFAAIGALNGVLSQVGDLAASAVKRHAGIKDYGNIMPGHGGVLDRVDSILFTAPAVYLYIIILII